MRIAYIIERYGVTSETFVADLVNGLAEQGHEICLFLDQKPSFFHYDRAIRFSVTGYMSKSFKLKVWAERFDKLFRKSNRHFGMKIHVAIAERQLITALSEFKPHVAYIDHGQNAVLARSSLIKLGIPFVVHFHGRDASQLLDRLDYIKEIQQVFLDAASIIVASGHIRRRLILSGCPESRIKLVRLGIEPSLIPAGDWRHRRSLPPSMIHLGRLTEKKNPIALLHTFHLVRKRIPEAQLTIIGDGSLRTAVVKRTRELGIERSSHILGSIQRERAVKILADQWVFVQHSVTSSNGDQEGFGVSMLEGACSGLPVVSTFHDGIPENVIDGVTGFLVVEYDYETMAKRVIDLMRNPNIAEKMGMAGRRRVLDHFQLRHRVNKICELLEKTSNRIRHL